MAPRKLLKFQVHFVSTDPKENGSYEVTTKLYAKNLQKAQQNAFKSMEKKFGHSMWKILSCKQLE